MDLLETNFCVQSFEQGCYQDQAIETKMTKTIFGETKTQTRHVKTEIETKTYAVSGQDLYIRDPRPIEFTPAIS